MIFSSEDVVHYISILCEEFGVREIMVKEDTIEQRDNCISFRGKREGAKNEECYVIPVDHYRKGVISAKSILSGKQFDQMKWLTNGQASKKCKEIVFVGFDAMKLLYLVASRKMVYDDLNRFEDLVDEDKRDGYKKNVNTMYEREISSFGYGDNVSIGKNYCEGNFVKMGIVPIEEYGGKDVSVMKP